MLKLEIFKLKIGSRHLFHFSTLIFIISNNVMFISDIVYISFALIICIINQIYLLNRRFVYIRKFDLHAPQWGGGDISHHQYSFEVSPVRDRLYTVCVCVYYFLVMAPACLQIEILKRVSLCHNGFSLVYLYGF